MKISLPKNYSYEKIAEVKDGILHLHKLYFDNLMFDLTYAQKAPKCHYCGRPISRCQSTLDHLYPKSLGGPTIPDNLAICCPECNLYKSNMTEEQFIHYCSIIDTKKKKEFYEEVSLSNDIFRRFNGPMIPKSWIAEEPIKKITFNFFVSAGINGKGYKKAEKNYKEYGRIDRPLVVDKNFKLLNGIYSFLFAKNNCIDTVPTIVLENVELN